MTLVPHCRLGLPESPKQVPPLFERNLRNSLLIVLLLATRVVAALKRVPDAPCDFDQPVCDGSRYNGHNWSLRSSAPMARPAGPYHDRSDRLTLARPVNCIGTGGAPGESGVG